MYKKRLVYSCDLGAENLRRFCQDKEPKSYRLLLKEGFHVAQGNNDNQLILIKKSTRNFPHIELEYTENKEIVIEMNRPNNYYLFQFLILLFGIFGLIYIAEFIVFQIILVLVVALVVVIIEYIHIRRVFNNLHQYFEDKFKDKGVVYILKEKYNGFMF